MTELTFDHLGIWAVRKREKSGLEELGFYNCYAGIDQLKCLVVRLDNFEKETMMLGVTKMHRLFVNDKDRFVMELKKLDIQVKEAKKIYKKVINKEKYNEGYFKSLSDMDVYRLRCKANEIPDGKRVLQLIAIKEAIATIIKYSSRPLNKIIELNPVNESDLPPARDGQDYTAEEDNFIVENYTNLSARKIGAHLGRTKSAITSRMRRLREEGRL